MKKFLTYLLALVMTFSLVLTGCSSSKEEAASSKDPAGDKKLKIACLLNGNLGDKSFFDSANKGMEQIKEKFGYETKTIEMGFDQSKWLPSLEDVS